MLKRTFYIFLLFTSIKAVGQRATSSPYSFFGIGQLYNPQTVEQASMGGLGTAFSDEYHLNLMNPAAHADLRLTTYSIGGKLNYLTINDGIKSQTTKSTSLSYINIGIPIGAKAGFVFGLQPNTSVGYSLVNTIIDNNGNIIEGNRFYGSGGTTRISGGFGMHVSKAFSVGFEVDYIFGKTENNVLNQRANVQLATNNNETNNIRGGSAKLGVQYKKELANKVIMHAGAAVKLKQNLRTTGSEYLYSLTLESGYLEVPRDTISATTTSGKIVVPAKTSFGIGFGKKDKWYAGVEYEFQGALNFQNSVLTNNSGYSYGASNKISFGGFYLPKINSISGYWKRVTYRAGLRFEKTGLQINNINSTGFTPIKDFGISFGLGLPLKALSNLNLGFEYGKKGTTSNYLIQENYFNIRVSLSLSDLWFRKVKIN